MTDGHTQRLESALAGRYKVQKRLGQGGMATVYLAEDIKHERNVALKILKPELAAVIGAERFLAEIKTTANLQHPHILPLFDSGEADGFLYYVMPFIDGETLRDKLDREKQLGVDEAVRIATSVADALDYAHRQGVIHRDIKPANILLHDGRPIVADFGIAVAISAAGGGRMTETGLSLGTPHYMSPEQASADRDLSARSDVYSLGCVLYEMIAGQPPHTGPSAQSILVRILTESPRPLTDMRHTVPAHVAATVMKSIEKLPADRFETAKAFREALADPTFTYAPAAATRPGPVVAPTNTGPARTRGIPIWAATVAGLVLLAAGYGLSRLATPAAPLGPSAAFGIVGDSTYQLTSPCCGRSIAISPAGDRLVYQGSPPGGQAQVLLYQRRLDQRTASPVPGTDDARHPFFSPDGQWIGFFSGSNLRKVRFDGGTPLTVASGLSTNAGAAWTPDNSIVFSTREDKVILRVVEGGIPEPVTELDTLAGEFTHYWPHVMPDGRTVLFGVGIRRDDGSTVDMIAETSLEGGGHRLLTAGADPRFVEPGFVVFSDAAGSIMAQRLDPRSMELSGERFRIAELATWRGDGSSEFDISRTGTLAYLQSPAWSAGVRELVSVDMEGQEQVLAAVAMSRAPRFSPDGRYIVYENQGTSEAENDDIWVWDQTRAIPIRVTFEGDNSYPVWSPDGSEILYERDGSIVARTADGAGETRVVQEAEQGFAEAPVLSPDGEWLLWAQRGADTQWDVWFRPLAGGDARPLLNSAFNEVEPAVSPDGRWIAYVSDASGTGEVYVEPFPALGRRFKLTTGGAYAPVWSPDGRRLYFVADGAGGEVLTVVDVRAGNVFDVGEPESLFGTTTYFTGGLASGYDIHPDDTRFVFVRGGGGGGIETQVVITNALNAGRAGRD